MVCCTKLAPLAATKVVPEHLKSSDTNTIATNHGARYFKDPNLINLIDSSEK
jgi:hypothetical protein